MEERDVLAYEMTPPQPPGIYELSPKGAILVVTFRDPKLGYMGGWTESLYSRTEWDRKNKSRKTFPFIQSSNSLHRFRSRYFPFHPSSMS